MKASLLCSATLFSVSALAFPTSLLNGDLSEEALAEINTLAAKVAREARTKRQLGIIKPGFNADAQRISTTGEHQYVCGHGSGRKRHGQVADDLFSDRARSE
jgi:hypothetical protein